MPSTQLELEYVCAPPAGAGTLPASLIIRDVVGNTVTIDEGITVEAA